jgi:hypothetical protein
VESTLIAVGAIALLSVVTLHQQSGADTSALLVQGKALEAVHDRTFLFGPGLRRHRQRNHPRRPDVEVGTRPPAASRFSGSSPAR